MAKAPGKSFRKGMSLFEALERFGDEAQAEAWFVNQRWPDGIECPYCDSKSISNRKSKRVTPQYHCKDCTKNFTVKTGTIMHDSKLSLSKWVVGFYLFSTNLKGVSSMKLRRDLGITQKNAWHMAHRIRETWNDQTQVMTGTVEVDETYIGGKEANKHASKKLKAGRGTIGKVAVVGIKDRDTNQVKTQVVQQTDRPTLQGFILENTTQDAEVITDEAVAYRGIERKHEAVKHSVGEYVRNQAHTNGIESHWALLKRGYEGTYHQMSEKHLQRYVGEFEGRHNVRPLNTEHQMELMAMRSVGKHLPYAELVAERS